MCTKACLDFVRANLQAAEVKGRSVIEVGSRDVNGSVGPVVRQFQPASYMGVDAIDGPGVDEICDASELVERFGPERFDVLISTEMLEHVRDWRTVVGQFKRVMKRDGILLITTRSQGFPYHEFPHDFWRYECSDIRTLFSDFKIEKLEKDQASPGVLFKARKPADFRENDMSGHELYSVIVNARVAIVTDSDLARFYRRRKRRRVLQTPERAFRRIRTRLWK